MSRRVAIDGQASTPANAAMALEPKHELAGVRACVFDAYGTLFDFAAAAERCRDDLGGKTDALTDIWRARQLQYTWLRSLMGRHRDFWQVTGDALDYALDALAIDDAALRERLLALYLELDPYPEAERVLAKLREAGLGTAILSNGSPDMLAAAVAGAGLESLLDEVISVEEVGVFKPHPEVYALVRRRLGVEPADVAYQSSNSWDAWAASAFGFRAVWINRGGAPRERMPEPPLLEVATLDELPRLVGAA